MLKVAVMSNKGGVGKTTLSINLAYALARMGKKVGLVDIDFHGPTMLIILGVTAKPKVTANGIVPPEVDGVKLLSLSMLMRKDDDPCLWSGETKRQMVLQFLGKSVIWGNVDVLVVDTPPSLGDENLVVADVVDKIIVVSTPHRASVYDVRKMLRLLKDKVVAVVLNDANNVDPSHVPVFDKPTYVIRFNRKLQDNPTIPVQEVEELAGLLLG
jgi:ATP-binding protein involved in chromosome partitioning